MSCPFCCKVRAFLDYHGISYDIVEVNPVLKQQMSWTKHYKKVPILLVKVPEGYIQMNDSSTIISTMASYLRDRANSISLVEVANFYPSIDFKDEEGNLKREVLNRYFLMYQNGTTIDDTTKETIVEERKWRKWVDNVFVHTLSPNVYRTREEALEAFNWFSQVGEWEKHFTPLERKFVTYVGATAMWMIGKQIKKKYQLKDDVRESLYDGVNTWLKEVRSKKNLGDFHGGKDPDLADLAVYGVLNSIEGCQAFSDLNRVTRLAVWYEKVKQRLATPLRDNDDTSPVISITP
ncbi:hypothetical protein AAG570_011969 [Ranatra chinensis]|uniref:Prostaglandin E synthase 2 n=1 Tax=Ranatra chinensis TaxID=642074 RepID=A0ABD0YHF7_9HEMI